MVLVIILAALSAWSLIALAIGIRRDGYRAVDTDWSRVPAEDEDRGNGARGRGVVPGRPAPGAAPDVAGRRPATRDHSGSGSPR